MCIRNCSWLYPGTNRCFVNNHCPRRTTSTDSIRTIFRFKKKQEPLVSTWHMLVECVREQLTHVIRRQPFWRALFFYVLITRQKKCAQFLITSLAKLAGIFDSSVSSNRLYFTEQYWTPQGLYDQLCVSGIAPDSIPVQIEAPLQSYSRSATTKNRRTKKSAIKEASHHPKREAKPMKQQKSKTAAHFWTATLLI